MKSALEAASQVLLAGWLGATWLFALVIAPTAFRVLPSVEVAGQLVGPILSVLNVYGIAAGISLGVISRILDRSTALQLLPFAMAVLCGVSEFSVTAAIGDVLPHDLQSAGDPTSAGRFATLHQASRVIFIAIAIGTVVLEILQSRARIDPTRSGAPERRAN